MFWGTFLIVLVTSYLFVSSGAQKICTCPNGHVDVEENKIITLRCEDVDDADTVMWKIGKSLSVLTDLATCPSPPSCIAVEKVAGADRNYNNGTKYSKLFLKGMRSQHDYVVVCEKKRPAGTSQSPPCVLNVTVTATASSGSTSPSSYDSMCLEASSQLSTGTTKGTSSQPSTGATKGPTTGTAIHSPQDTNPTDTPVGAIVGGAVAAFVVVIVIVVAVIIVRRKKKRERSRKDASHEHQMHYNPENGTGVALETSQNDDNNAYAGPPEFGIYAFPGGGEPATIPDNTPTAEEDNFGMYAAPKADVYAAVDKSKQKKNKPAKSDDIATSQAATVADEYAVVNKASRKKGVSNPAAQPGVNAPENNDASAAPAPYIYAQVDKTARNAKTAVSVPKTPEEEGATYAQVQKPKKK